MAICNWVVYDCWLLTVICKLATNFQLGAQINVLTPLCLLLPHRPTYCCKTVVLFSWSFTVLFFSILLCISPFTNLCSFPSLSNHYKNAHSTSTIEEMKLCFYPKVLAIHKYCSFRVVGYKSNLFPGLKPGKSIVCNNLSSLKTLNIFYIFILPPTLAHTRRYLTLRKEDKWHGHVIEKISMVYSPTSFQNIFLLQWQCCKITATVCFC